METRACIYQSYTAEASKVDTDDTYQMFLGETEEITWSTYDFLANQRFKSSKNK